MSNWKRKQANLHSSTARAWNGSQEQNGHWILTVLVEIIGGMLHISNGNRKAKQYIHRFLVMDICLL